MLNLYIIIMNKHFTLLLIGTLSLLALSACDDIYLNESISKPLIENLDNQSIKPKTIYKYVDDNWTPTSVIENNLLLPVDTNFMNSQINNIASMWGRSIPVLKFVDDPNNFRSTKNAITSLLEGPHGSIYYGYALYYDARAKGGDIVNAMVLSHEYGHLLQQELNLPSVNESTSRAYELEADGYAGYYLRRPNGYNRSNFSEIAAAYEYVGNGGDTNISSSDHHGTQAQRRAAVYLGFLLGNYELSAAEFDQYFFYYYQDDVLNGNNKIQKKTQNSELDIYIMQYIEQLRKIKTGEIDAVQFRKL